MRVANDQKQWELWSEFWFQREQIVATWINCSPSILLEEWNIVSCSWRFHWVIARRGIWSRLNADNVKSRILTCGWNIKTIYDRRRVLSNAINLCRWLKVRDLRYCHSKRHHTHTEPHFVKLHTTVHNLIISHLLQQPQYSIIMINSLNYNWNDDNNDLWLSHSHRCFGLLADGPLHRLIGMNWVELRGIECANGTIRYTMRLKMKYGAA